MEHLFALLAVLLLAPAASRCADKKGLNRIDVTANLAALAATAPAFIHIKAFDLPAQAEKLVITAPGVVRLGEVLAKGYLEPK